MNINMDIICWVITGGLAVSVINNLGNIVLWVLGRKASLTDRKQPIEEKYNNVVNDVNGIKGDISSFNQSLDDISKGLSVILYDRTWFLASKYISEKEVDIEQKATIEKMNNAYKSITRDANNQQEALKLQMLIDEVDKLHIKPTDIS